MNPSNEFQNEKLLRIQSYESNRGLRRSAIAFLNESIGALYSYNFDFLSRPIIQYPQDIVAMQEIIWQVKPDLIIETGVAHGGSLILSASMLAILDYCDAVEKKSVLDPFATNRRVLGIDIDIRSHNRDALEAHPLSHRIDLIQGSSTSLDVKNQVYSIAKNFQRVLVCLDSNHTNDHVFTELELYAPLTSKGSYCCVFDTVIEDLPEDLHFNRSWKQGNNPKTAVWKFLEVLKKERRKGIDGDRLTFEIDKALENKLLITVAPDGYLKRVN